MEQITSKIVAGGFSRLDLRVSVPAPVVNATYARVLQDFRREVQVDGYRVGKAPLAAVRRLVGNNLERRVAVELVKHTANKAARAQGLPPVGNRPDAFSSQKLAEGHPFEFRVRLENIRARVTKLASNYMKIPLVRPSLWRNTSRVENRQIHKLLFQHAESRTRGPEEQAESGDRVTFSCTVIDNQQPQPQELRNGKQQTTVLGREGKILRIITRSLHGMRCGETRRIARIIDLDQNWRTKHMNGKKVVFDLTLHQVEELVLPELTDAFVKRVTDGVTSITALRDKIRQEYEEQNLRNNTEWMEGFLEHMLVEESEVEIPPILLDRVTKILLDDVQKRGAPSEQLANKSEEEVIEYCHEEAERIISVTAILEEIARREGIVVRSERDGMESAAYTDLRRVVTRFLLKNANIVSTDDKDKEKYQQQQSDKERLAMLRRRFIERSKVVRLGKYEDIKLEKKTAQVTEEDIDAHLEELRQENSTFQETDAPVARGAKQRIKVASYLVVDGKTLPDSIEMNTIDAPSEGDEELTPREWAIIGMRAGQLKIMQQGGELPPELAASVGTKVEQHVVVRMVYKVDFAEIDDQFAREFCDAENLAALRERIRQELEQQHEEHQHSSMLVSAVSQLLHNSELEKDEETLREIAHIIPEGSESMQISSIDQSSEIKEQLGSINARQMVMSIRDVLIAEVAKREKITLDDDEPQNEDFDLEEPDHENRLAPENIFATDKQEEVEEEDDHDRLFVKVGEFLLKKVKISVITDVEAQGS